MMENIATVSLSEQEQQVGEEKPPDLQPRPAMGKKVAGAVPIICQFKPQYVYETRLTTGVGLVLSDFRPGFYYPACKNLFF
jgi:hypothetical protein